MKRFLRVLYCFAILVSFHYLPINVYADGESTEPYDLKYIIGEYSDGSSDPINPVTNCEQYTAEAGKKYKILFDIQFAEGTQGNKIIDSIVDSLNVSEVDFENKMGACGSNGCWFVVEFTSNTPGTFNVPIDENHSFVLNIIENDEPIEPYTITYEIGESVTDSYYPFNGMTDCEQYTAKTGKSYKILIEFSGEDVSQVEEVKENVGNSLNNSGVIFDFVTFKRFSEMFRLFYEFTPKTSGIYNVQIDESHSFVLNVIPDEENEKKVCLRLNDAYFSEYIARTEYYFTPGEIVVIKASHWKDRLFDHWVSTVDLQFVEGYSKYDEVAKIVVPNTDVSVYAEILYNGKYSWQYQQNEDNTITITHAPKDFFGYGHVIPDVIDGKVVTGIESTSFYNTDTDFQYSWFIPESLINIAPQSLPTAIEYEVSANNPVYQSIDGVIYTRDLSELVQYPANKDADTFIVPEEVKILGDGCFNKNAFISQITLPPSLEIIGDDVFSCMDLEEISIPDSVLEIGKQAFAGLPVDRIVLPPHLKTIEDGLFQGSSITELLLPDSIQEIKSGAFYGCENIEHIQIPDNVTIIGNNAFTQCSSLIEITIPETVNELGYSVFWGCQSLEEVTILNPKIIAKSDIFNNDKNLKTVYFAGTESQWEKTGIQTSETTEVKCHGIDVNYIEINNGNPFSVNVNETKQISTLVAPDNATDKSISWQIEDDSIATIDENGKITGNKAGETRIIAVSDSTPEITSTCKLIVIRPVANIILDKTELSINVSETAELKATVEPSDANNKTVTWKSSDEKVATVDGTGKVTAVAEGTATITVTTEDGNKTATCEVTVKDKQSVTGVELSEEEVKLELGSSKQLTTSVKPADAENKNVTWISDNKNVAEVDNTGKVTVKKPGVAHITVTTEENGYTDTCKVTVLFDDVTSSDQYYYDAVYWAADHDITQGNSPTTFNPGGFCKRYQFVLFLWRQAGCPEPTLKTDPFTDVLSDPKKDAYEKAVLWAVENKITTGTTATTFDPYAPLTRGQVVTFLHRAAGEPEVETIENPFIDVYSDKYYYKAVLWAVENKVTTGLDGTHFGPTNTCTRGQTVTFLYRLFGGEDTANNK